MHNITDKDILAAIEFLLAFGASLFAAVGGLKIISREWGNRGKIVEGLQEDTRKITSEFTELKHRIDTGHAELSGLKKDVEKIEKDYDSLIDKLLDRYKTTRSR